LPSTDKEVFMTVIIGVDPHKQSHTPLAICGDEREVAKVTVRASCQQTTKLLAWAKPFEQRMWAIESAGGLGYLLAQQLVDAGEHVVDVPPTLASRIRVLGTGRSDKNDPNDALSVAVAAMRSDSLRQVETADHAEIMRLLAKRNHDLGRMRARLICRLHNALADLSPGGIAKELYVSDADRLLGSYEPVTPIEHMRHQLARELVDDVRRLDTLIKESHCRIRTAVRASKTSLTEVYGVGPIVACMVIGLTGDVGRFANQTTSPPMRAWLRSNIPREVESRTASRVEAIESSTTPSTLLPSPRSAIREQMVGSTLSERWPRARPSAKP
jgi:transposase